MRGIKNRLTMIEIKAPEQKYRVVIIPDEKLDCPASELESINVNGQDCAVYDRYTFAKGDTFPVGLMLLATGQVFDSTKAWEKYINSTNIYFFIIEL